MAGINFIHPSSRRRIFKASLSACRRVSLNLIFVSILIGFPSPLGNEAKAGNKATQIIRFQILGVSEIAVSGNPALLVVEKDNPLKREALDGSTSYSIITNLSNQKITGKIDAPMPAGVTLTLKMAPPDGASGAGEVVLSNTDADLVTGIYRKRAGNLPITYRLSANPQSEIQMGQRTVTFTITH